MIGKVEDVRNQKVRRVQPRKLDECGRRSDAS